MSAAGVAAASYVFLGLTPLFWQRLGHVRPSVLVAERVLASVVFLFFVLGLRRARGFREVLVPTPARLGWVLAGALLMAVNWYVFVTAVSTGRVLEASLGYFLSPLASVALGIFFFGEAPTRARIAAIALAAIATLSAALSTGGITPVAASLAASIALYGAIKKRTRLPAVVSVFVECLLLSPWAIVHLLRAPDTGSSWPFLALMGPITALPLVALAFAAPRIEISLLGLYFYLTPAVQLALALFVYREPVGGPKATALALTVLALVVLGADVVRSRRSRQRADRCRRDPSEG